MRSIALLSFATLAGVFALPAQEARLSIAGTAVNSLTGEPVKHALVVLNDGSKRVANPRANASATRPRSTTALTDAVGAFRFDSLPPGSYTLTAQKPEFVWEHGKTSSDFSFELTASREGLRLPLAPLGVITGKAIDRDGQPVAHVNVVAIGASIQNGFLFTSTSRTVSTDDRGIYRMWNLQPGKYYIKAAGRSGGTSTYLGDVPPWYTSEDAFLPVYSGGTATLESAAPIIIGPGAQATADLSVRLEPAFKIRGTISNFASTPAVRFELVIAGEPASASRVSLNSTTGRFEIQDVVSGSYTLRAIQASNVGEVPVQVKGADVTGIALALFPPDEITVITRFSGEPDVESFQAIEDSQSIGKATLMAAYSCQVWLHPAVRRDRVSFFFSATRVPAANGAPNNGENAILDVTPGVYHVQIMCPLGYPTTALFGTQELLANPTLTIQPGVRPPAIEITGKFGGGTASGKLDMPNIDKGAQIGVLLVPQFAGSTGPFFDSVERDDDGTFEFAFTNLAPGIYSAYAFSNPDSVEYRNPEFLRLLTGGTGVQVTDGAESRVVIRELVK
ncbi:MAG TPA: carboxypeptidase-like regulatory domain-containing protein [Bryobacteraceae bacterium]|jgi:protocatechuate 3,4-dioxygenase beta subunit|nr:carboxypeptidase-like regulatory domain-containing protein [Bryobacteraceae bacterium]